jgi:hypothetical protein
MCALYTLANKTNGLDDRRPCIFMPYFSFLRHCVCLRIIFYAEWLPAALCPPFRLLFFYLPPARSSRASGVDTFFRYYFALFSFARSSRASGVDSFLVTTLGPFISHEVHVRTGLITFFLPRYHYLPSSRSKFTRERGCCFRFSILLFARGPKASIWCISLPRT